MIIKSKVKDYYDHVLRFGQDPNVIYLRGDLPATAHACSPQGPYGVNYLPWTRQTVFRDTFERYAWGGARGKGRRQIRVGSDYRMDFLIAGPHCIALACHKDGAIAPLGPAYARFLERDGFGLRADDPPKFPELPTPDEITALTRTVGAPVFIVCGVVQGSEMDRKKMIQIDSRLPIMSTMGIPAVIPAEQMWQGIFSTLQNVLRDNPDKAPPVQVADKYRFEEAGFDNTTSFRHPVK